MPRPRRWPTVKLRMPSCCAEHPPVDMHNLSRLRRLGPEPRDDIGITAFGHEADVLAVGLVGNGQAKLRGNPPRLGLGQ